MGEYKIIYDPVHGTVKTEGVLMDLLRTPELNRLNRIKQLGLSYLVFPGAHHTRFEHSLGTSHVAGMLGEEIDLDKSELELVRSAALLHDLGHGPFSHTLEKVIHERIGKEHMEITKEIITGSYDLASELGGEPDLSVPTTLENHGLDPKEVADLVCTQKMAIHPEQEKLTIQDGQSYFPTRSYLYQIIHSALDSDQLDFLLRDSKYTGVAFGVIDLDRIVQTAIRYHGELMIHKRGISALEGMLVARSLMYSSVYFHKTARIAESMLVRAAKNLDDDKLRSIWNRTDGEVFHLMSGEEGPVGDITNRLLLRRLFKSAYRIESEELVGESGRARSLKDLIRRLSNDREREKVEKGICRKANVQRDYVILDVPDPSLTLSEPRLRRTDVKVLGDTVETLSRISGLARALHYRPAIPWCLMVSCPENKKEIVRSVSKKILEDEIRSR